MARSPTALLPLLLVLAATALAAPDEAARLRDENERLRVRIETLERENARLRDLAGLRPDEPASARDRVRITDAPDGERIEADEIALVVTDGSRAAHVLHLGTDADGRARGVIETTFSSGIHRYVDALELVLDGETVRVPVVDYDATRVSAGPPQRRRRRDHERVTVALPPAVLGRAAEARTLDARLGRVRFRLDATGRATLRAFADAVSARTQASTPP